MPRRAGGRSARACPGRSSPHEATDASASWHCLSADLLRWSASRELAGLPVMAHITDRVDLRQ